MTPKETNWEEEFEKKRLALELSASPVWEDYIRRYHNSIKSFISYLLLSEKAKWKKELVEELRGMRREIILVDHEFYSGVEFNQALEQAISIIEKE